MTTLTIFANYCINDEERFLRLKDSFNSFKDVNPAKWVVNVRGKYKSEVLAFLKENVGDKLVPYALESKEGWFADCKEMLKDVHTDYVLPWVEDHMNIAPISDFQETLDEMKESGSEYVCYSWWVFGKINETYADLERKDYKHISTFVLDKKATKRLRKYTKSPSRLPAVISHVGIFSLNLFRRVIVESPGFMRWYPRYLPFDIEKLSNETKWLPINYAIMRHELFCSIDDDMRVPGSSLISRGLYPARVAVEKEGPDALPAKWRVIFRTYIGKYFPEWVYDMKYNFSLFRSKLKRSLYYFIKGI